MPQMVGGDSLVRPIRPLTAHGVLACPPQTAAVPAGGCYAEGRHWSVGNGSAVMPQVRPRQGEHCRPHTGYRVRRLFSPMHPGRGQTVHPPCSDPASSTPLPL
jgi:hypothetical protein